MAEKKTEKIAAKPAAKPAEAVKAAKAKPRVSRKEVKAARREAKLPTGPHATLRYLSVTPRKVRLVANEVRGMKVGDALALLKFTPQAAASPLAKLLRSAVANAEQKGGNVDVDALFVKTLQVDQGPKMRRFMARAMGRANKIEKKTSHVFVELGIAARG